MKPFNLEEALAGKPICTRKGLPARILDTNLKGRTHPIVVAILSGDGCEYVRGYAKDGKLFSTLETEDDLVMAPQKRTGWINIYKNNILSAMIYQTKEEAYDRRSTASYIDTIQITWEE